MSHEPHLEPGIQSFPVARFSLLSNRESRTQDAINWQAIKAEEPWDPVSLTLFLASTG